MRIHPFFIDMVLLCNCLACCGQLVKIHITLEPYRILESIFLILSIHPGMQNGGEGLSIIILDGQGRLVKMLITLEPQGIF